MKLREITPEELNPEAYAEEQAREIRRAVGDGTAINALSGGVDSSVVTLLGHRALGDRLHTVFVENGLMRDGEADRIVKLFAGLDVKVELVRAEDVFFGALAGLTDPEQKREAITRAFYQDVFGRLVRGGGAKHLLQGTNLTDVEETVAGVKRQHNILSQLGIDPERRYGYRVIEPVLCLRKAAIRRLGRALGLPGELCGRPPFPGPALAARVVGEVTPERVALIRRATAIVEELLEGSGAFQYLAILHEDRVTGMRDGKREFGCQVEVRCWDSEDARTGRPTRLSFDLLDTMAARITGEVPGVVSVTYNVTTKPPSTIEAI
ncbi:MAG TPA: ExsB family transcriptional regulator [candidate division WOR-3 bacterium]|uniref:GMP synthase (glutamine-hydrolyzing) n=1 Tax=candidate division WOR-3 bacterium TaxID=2052148 RepID=A0A7V0T461_UNCW3|nr:ExsB family transcriptional regulator [candidate division WOR-3 bacterium]